MSPCGPSARRADRKSSAAHRPWCTVSRRRRRRRRKPQEYPVRGPEDRPGGDRQRLRPTAKMAICVGPQAAQECLAHFRPHLKGPGPNTGSEPGQYLTGGAGERAQCRLQYAGAEPPPPRMRGSHHSAIARGEQHRKTVRRKHRAGQTRLIGPAGIRLRPLLQPRAKHRGTVHLAQPLNARESGQSALQPLPIRLYRLSPITHMCGQIEGIPGGRADAPASRRAQHQHRFGPALQSKALDAHGEGSDVPRSSRSST